MRVPATQPVLERYVRWIEEYLSAHDQQVKVAGTVALVAPGEFAVVFRPAGDLPVVALVTFRGNSVVPQTVLHEAITSAAVGTPYTEDRFRDILNSSIRPIYEARGRLRVSFPEIRTEPTTDVKGLRVFVTVNEGESYNFGEIRIEGELPVRAESLLKASNLKPGDMANFDKLKEGLENIRKAVRHDGYMDTKVAADHKIDEGKKAVDVTVHVDAGQQYLTGKLNIVGLDLTSEAEVKRIWTMTDGKPFNPEYPDYFLNRIREENIFDNLGPTKSDTHVDANRRVVDVTLTFSGAEGGPGRGGRGRGGRGGRGY
jgi:outer membrane protein assembly factor BamA